ncbi:hypothetical protein [Mesorhizobium sp. ANAO-SY3R2]|uniref:hypothetical protein n=1 Tax=Mesorhizobium sp. ANAO-SY3R2 TaxID=3166644 RepID=UPI003672D2A2
MQSLADVKCITRELGDMLAPHRGWQEQVSAVHRELTKNEFAWSIPGLSWNRVKAWFYGEARRIDYEHMVALKELKATQEARREHLEFLAATNRMAALLAAEGASLSGAQLEALQRVASRQAHAASRPDKGSGGTVRGMVGAGDHHPA